LGDPNRRVPTHAYSVDCSSVRWRQAGMEPMVGDDGGGRGHGRGRGWKGKGVSSSGSATGRHLAPVLEDAPAAALLRPLKKIRSPDRRLNRSLSSLSLAPPSPDSSFVATINATHISVRVRSGFGGSGGAGVHGRVATAPPPAAAVLQRVPAASAAAAASPAASTAPANDFVRLGDPNQWKPWNPLVPNRRTTSFTGWAGF
jgi:hypothetical protein